MEMTHNELLGNYIFGLDIGTRSIVGIVGYEDHKTFKIAASSIVEHDTRAMIDGQIHDINKVSQTIKKVKDQLEKKLGFELDKVCIAAAGRVLKTTIAHVEQEIDSQKPINDDQIYALELLGMEKAHQEINVDLEQNELGYHCVGYSVIDYYLNDYEINKLEGHKGKKMGADVLATFLPNEVVNSLYKVVENAGLSVYSLTLEPIAAISVAIPENYRLLNIALVDIGAGTSDIAITRDGSIIAYGMIPYAGDEITETLIHHFLVDFATAEKIKIMASSKRKTITYKDIMGLSHKTTKEEINKIIRPKLEELSAKIADKIMALNGKKSTNAVFIVGGGGQLTDFSKYLSKKLKIDEQRVALRGKEILEAVETDDQLKKSPEIVTPIGICITGLVDNKHDFLQVFFNDEPINIFNTNHLTVMDVAAFKGFNPKSLLPNRGEDLTYRINGLDKAISGEYGEPATIMINHETASLSSPVEMNDYISIIPAKNGTSAKQTTHQLLQEVELLEVTINGDLYRVKQNIIVNSEKVLHNYDIKTGDDIQLIPPTINQVISKNSIYYDQFLMRNGIAEDLNANIADGDIIETIPAEVKKQVEDELSLFITVNDNVIELKGKKKYVLADIFDYIEFDRSKSHGEIVCKKNNENAGFMDEVSDNDRLEIYWSEEK